MILILGKGTLAQAIHKKTKDSICVGRSEFDFSSKADCDRLIDSFNPSVVINTVALNENNDIWDILTTNYTSLTYLTFKFYDKMSSGLIVNISSASTLWVSYPNISSHRLVYNLSKESVSNFVRHFNRSIVDHDKNVTICVAELGRFPSKFNNYQTGTDVNVMADHIIDIINNPKQQVTVI